MIRAANASWRSLRENWDGLRQSRNAYYQILGELSPIWSRFAIENSALNQQASTSCSISPSSWLLFNCCYWSMFNCSSIARKYYAQIKQNLGHFILGYIYIYVLTWNNCSGQAEQDKLHQSRANLDSHITPPTLIRIILCIRQEERWCLQTWGKVQQEAFSVARVLRTETPAVTHTIQGFLCSLSGATSNRLFRFIWRSIMMLMIFVFYPYSCYFSIHTKLTIFSSKKETELFSSDQSRSLALSCSR